VDFRQGPFASRQRSGLSQLTIQVSNETMTGLLLGGFLFRNFLVTGKCPASPAL
jgi:hypothetical protein